MYMYIYIYIYVGIHQAPRVYSHGLVYRHLVCVCVCVCMCVLYRVRGFSTYTIRTFYLKVPCAAK